MEAIKALLKQITAFWSGKDKRFKRNAIIIAASALVLVIIVSVILNQVPYSTLYSGLSSGDASSVMQALDDQKEPYKVEGDTILVPSKDVDKLRMSLSTEVKSTFNLDILKQGQGLGTTESQMDDYRKAQLEYDLQNSIRTVEGVEDVRVLLTIPKETSFVLTSDKQYSTASLLITFKKGVEPDPDQVKAIFGFVQKAVPGLTQDNISIMDNNMQNLDSSSTDGFGDTNDQYKLQDQVESKLRKQVMALLLPIFGMGRVEAQVNAVLDFDNKVTDSTTYKPVVNDKDGVITSYQKIKEQITNGTDAGGETGTNANTGTGNNTTTYPVVSGSNGTYEKTEDKVNLEVNSIVEHLEQAKGKIQSLTVSVVIDNTNLKTDLTENVKNLVKNAVGADAANISVEYVPMQGTADTTAALQKDSDLVAAKDKDKQMQLYIIVGAIVLPVMLAMLLAFLYGKSRHKAEAAAAAAAMAPEPANIETVEQMEEEEKQELQDLSDIRIVKDSGSKEQIGKLIDKNPELVANLLRSWLSDDQE